MVLQWCTLEQGHELDHWPSYSPRPVKMPVVFPCNFLKALKKMATGNAPRELTRSKVRTMDPWSGLWSSHMIQLSSTLTGSTTDLEFSREFHLIIILLYFFPFLHMSVPVYTIYNHIKVYNNTLNSRISTSFLSIKCAKIARNISHVLRISLYT